MSKITGKLLIYLSYSMLIIIGAFINWWLPIYVWAGDTPVYRFIWLGIFFVLLDMEIEVVLKAVKQLRLVGEMMGFARDIRKVSSGFHVAAKAGLPNGLKADFVVVGSSGVWLVTVKDDKGKITFNGDDLIQDGTVLKGILTQSLEKAYSLAGMIKEKLKREFIVTPVVAFSSPQADLGSAPKIMRGVYVSSRKDVVQLIENTDIQLVDQRTAEEIDKMIKK